MRDRDRAGRRRRIATSFGRYCVASRPTSRHDCANFQQTDTDDQDDAPPCQVWLSIDGIVEGERLWPLLARTRDVGLGGTEAACLGGSRGHRAGPTSRHAAPWNGGINRYVPCQVWLSIDGIVEGERLWPLLARTRDVGLGGTEAAYLGGSRGREGSSSRPDESTSKAAEPSAERSEAHNVRATGRRAHN